MLLRYSETHNLQGKLIEILANRGGAVFLSVCLLLSGCAGSMRQDSKTQSAPVPIPNRGEEEQTIVAYSPLDVFTPPTLLPRQDEPYSQPYTPPTVLPRQDEYVQPYTLPTVISRSEPVKLTPNPRTTNPCLKPISEHPALSYDICNRARIPGLTPLYEMVSANVSARVAAGETIQKLGVILDSGAHGVSVRTARETITLPELMGYFDYTEIGVQSGRETWRSKFRALAGLGYQRPIVSVSYLGIWGSAKDVPPSNPYGGRIAYFTVRDTNALLVLPMGNNGGRRLDPAAKEIHEKTGSLLVVTGFLDYNDHQREWKIPLVDENGFHTGYTIDSPLTQTGHRCGDFRDFCIAAPYELYRRPNFIFGTSIATPIVAATLINLRYVWPHLTNRQLVRLACVTAVDLGEPGNDPVWGCGQLSVSAIWQPTGELVSDPVAEFSLPVASGSMSLSGASFSGPVTVTGYENNEFRRDYEVAVAASDSGTSVRIDPTVSWNSLNSILRFRQNGATSLPLADGRGSATHIFKDTFLFLKGSENSFGALGLSHGSGFSIAFERETDSFFGSAGSGSYKFGDTNKIVASFDREFQMGKTYNAGLKLAAAYGKMEPDISLVNSASGGAQTAQLSVGRKGNNFETRVEMSYSTGLKGEISVQNTNYRLRPISEKAIMLKMRLAI